jgi:UDP-N-acetylglucosamine 1-carboxyvinyltransferase
MAIVGATQAGTSVMAAATSAAAGDVSSNRRPSRLTVRAGALHCWCAMAPIFIVEGGHRLSGTVQPAGNKNAALPILAASLLADGPCVLENVPRIRDVETMLALLVSLGVTATWEDEHTLALDGRPARHGDPDPELCRKIRASVLLAGPLLARFGRVRLPPPGGDVIGRRRIDTHLLALQRLGAEIEVGATYDFEAKQLVGTEVFLDEASVTGTENALMAAVAARGRTVLRNAASEPHVQDLARFLVALGAAIDGIGTNTLAIEGGRPLGGARFALGPDHIEIGSFIGLAAVTNGALTIEGVRPDDLRATLLAFDRMGIRPRSEGDRLIVDRDQERRIRPDLGGHVPQLYDGPWPGFPADLMSIAVVAATQCEGLLLVFEKMFESRLYFVDKLIGMGARIVLCDPHRAVIAGPAPLRGQVVESPDIRAGMAILLAALAAEGESTIHNIGQIERGYEAIDARLRGLGADIRRTE